ncbi:MAG: hypothetical protein ABT15_32950 [Pseudonocardia sp. SCN 73-27]|uniref:hypothetical protein n=1 Tax=Pseudonocardia sp. SCN 73-27 TaxID=1660132 RepID=UPI0008698F5D|nr:hypothetical protein [Pseudonocardia sp. SCN 73-27]ODU98912.1 MAG: hypothetical protein ABT15_32950 [Pseudonocardia sp. SCN 73-27]
MTEDRSGRPTFAQDAHSTLMLQAARVIRMRYVKGSRDSALSPAAASKLADVMEGLSNGDPAFDRIDPNEATALAHRLIDDDHPEVSKLWPVAT